jgi:hypothetical protein
LIKVHAASVNPLDRGELKGVPFIFRIVFGLRKPEATRPGRPGVDVAGLVEAVGRNVTQFKPGDEVFGVCISNPHNFGVKVWVTSREPLHFSSRVRWKSCPARAEGRISMQRLIGSLTILLFLGLVIIRVILMRRSGVKAVYFANIDKKDFLIPPFAFLYIYIVIAAPLGLPAVTKQEFFRSEALSWVGYSYAYWVCCCSLLASFRSAGVSVSESTRTTQESSSVLASLHCLGIPSMWPSGSSCLASS